MLKKKSKSGKSAVFKRIILIFAVILALATFLGFNWYHTALQPVASAIDCQGRPQPADCKNLHSFEFSSCYTVRVGRIYQNLNPYLSSYCYFPISY